MAIHAGTSLGRYQIHSLLGTGGMGEVYLAEDTKLGRKVAVKLLPSQFTINQDRLRRFEQEACAASSLNHPNIITIHEIGSEDDTHFITMEFIDGVTLRQHTAGKQVALREVLDINMQVASALTAAHAAGIVHRDIKPENIMVRRDGYVKVLDFGLAKLAEPQTHRSDPEAATIVKTEPGIIMGTASYMSPEQARGQEVDARTDIWSLGVVIYEMITGRLPFEGQTSSDVISLILQKEPLALGRHASEVPTELERIIAKALTKDREERYQTAKDLLIDLKRLKQQLNVDAEIERTVPPELRGTTSGTGYSSAVVEATRNPPSRNDEVEPARPTSSAEYLVNRIKQHKRWAVPLGVAAIILATLAIFYLYSTRASKAAIDSIAVLPFVNANTDPNTEYLADGITENIIYRLSQLPELKVMSRNSVFRYKGREQDAREVGRELGVRAVLSGRVAQRGDQLVISTEMVDAGDNRLLWGQQYNRKLTDLLTVQEEISREISEKLRLKLTGAEQKRLTQRYTENTQAYQLYTQGRYHWNKRTPEDIRRAQEYFSQAIDLDPRYALAYAGLADCYALLTDYGVMAPKDAALKTNAAAMKALEIDDALAEAHTSLAFIKERYDWDAAGAEIEFKRAIELNPNYATARHWYSEYLSNMGRHEEALVEARRAQELDPLSLIVNTSLGTRFFVARQYDEAVRQLLKTLELDRNFPRARFRLGLSYSQKQMHAEAVAELQKTVEISGRDSIYVASLAYVYGMSGQKGEALKLLDELKQRSHREYVSPYYMAAAYVGLGEKDQALAWLERAHQERDFWLRLLKVDPVWDSIRSDPRFADILRRIGFA
jgi:serine/threonine protein kinase/Tfp pilus assembly protein PilF